MAKLFEQFFEQFGQSLPMYFISMYYKHLHIQYTKTICITFLLSLFRYIRDMMSNSKILYQS